MRPAPLANGGRRNGKGHPADDGEQARRERRKRVWVKTASRRRVLLGLLVSVPTIIAAGFMYQTLPDRGWPSLEVITALVFGLLFGWISVGMWTAVAGFFVLLRRGDRWSITRVETEGEPMTGPPEGRTAVIMPICEESVPRVFAGLEVIYQSLAKTGAQGAFDFFILSDTKTPETGIEEEAAWAELCRRVGGTGRIFYRRRRSRPKRKNGNVAEFCRRWGSRYSYAFVLDADSLVNGETIVRLARLMDRRSDVGLIQTAPRVVRGATLFARAQQFASGLYGPLFAAGLHFWQLGDGQYWGHNAIFRLAPFMEHCGLPRLPGKPPFGGEILSHDFVESALLARAGWSVWLAYDVGGSWEESPNSLLEELARDRRWCQGNLQHLRLLVTRGFYGAHRTLFVNGVMSYVSALLWLTFIVLGTAHAALAVFFEPDYFPKGRALFPEWPVWNPDWAMALFSATMLILFLPKALAVLWAIPQRKEFGGFSRLWASVLIEIVFSSLLAPVRMMFHTKFVLFVLARRTVSWRTEQRHEDETTWGNALRRHGPDGLVAVAWGAGLYWLDSDFFWWVVPVLGALAISVPLSVLSSRQSVGVGFRRMGLLLIPEEVKPPELMRNLDVVLERKRHEANGDGESRDGFVRAIVDPYVNAVHRSLLRGPRQLAPPIEEARRELAERAIRNGPAVLDRRERARLLNDARLLEDLHLRVWSLGEPSRSGLWGVPTRASQAPTFADS
ncbi:MAG: glucans biosynthesis glucosyltransferase MdoH [Deltaproteobacteria bacterium]|nr:glucans biosynthesis glucosyltransferase MdoH [Deltaproteobacteria bacterium]